MDKEGISHSGGAFLYHGWKKHLEANPDLLANEDRDNRKILLKEGLEKFQK